MARLRYDVSMPMAHRGNCEYLDGTDHVRLQEGKIGCLVESAVDMMLQAVVPWPAIESTKASKTDLSAKTFGTDSSNEKKRRLANLETQTLLDNYTSKLLDANSQKWKDQPITFLQRFKLQAFAFKDHRSRLAAHCLLIPSDDSLNTILRRFYCAALGKTKRGRGAALGIAKPIYEAGVFSTYSHQLLAKKICGLYRAGSKYVDLIQEFGAGSLVVLGQNIGPSTYVVEMQKSLIC